VGYLLWKKHNANSNPPGTAAEYDAIANTTFAPINV
jgi:hypothetical protein